MTEDINEFEAYLNYLAEELGHADRHAGLKGYCSGLVLPLSRKSVEPMAAHIDPRHASASFSRFTILLPRPGGPTMRSCSRCASG